MTEQLPNPASRVTLASRRDRFGMPQVRLDWRLSPLDTRSATRGLEILAAAVHDAGLGTVRSTLGRDTLFHGEWHHLGTTRMHTDPRRGVVDPDGRVHGVRNLFVTGGSVFPTGGYANPTLTIVALAVRLGDHLQKVLAGS